jgi:hypothetical protein
MSWSNDARARIIFLVLDAPPHQDPKVIEHLQKLIKEAAAKGIRIVPLTCSGIDKSTEYLMRTMALGTNGTYVFLTDDSGIGDKHIKPTTDKWDVELLNDLLVRLINQYVTTPTCENVITVEPTDIKDSVIVVTTTIDTAKIDNPNPTDTVKTDIPKIEYSVKLYPNPTNGPLNIEITGEIKEFFLCDMSGKILERHETDEQTKFELYLGNYPQGMYFIRYFVEDIPKNGKVILMY